MHAQILWSLDRVDRIYETDYRQLVGTLLLVVDYMFVATGEW
jgi:hypothetical protein